MERVAPVVQAYDWYRELLADEVDANRSTVLCRPAAVVDLKVDAKVLIVRFVSIVGWNGCWHQWSLDRRSTAQHLSRFRSNELPKWFGEEQFLLNALPTAGLDSLSLLSCSFHARMDDAKCDNNVKSSFVSSPPQLILPNVPFAHPTRSPTPHIAHSHPRRDPRSRDLSLAIFSLMQFETHVERGHGGIHERPPQLVHGHPHS